MGGELFRGEPSGSRTSAKKPSRLAGATSGLRVPGFTPITPCGCGSSSCLTSCPAPREAELLEGRAGSQSTLSPSLTQPSTGHQAGAQGVGAGQGRGESQQLERSVACPLHPPLACPGIADTSFLPRVSLYSLPPPSSPPLHSEVLAGSLDPAFSSSAFVGSLLSFVIFCSGSCLTGGE